MFKRIIQFLTDVRSEFKKITWPTKDQTIKQTGIVVGISLVTALFLGVVDLGLSELVKQVIG